MSRDIKYIGMDVHKEATMIAVLNGSGKLVMESIVPQFRSLEPSLSRIWDDIVPRVSSFKLRLPA